MKKSDIGNKFRLGANLYFSNPRVKVDSSVTAVNRNGFVPKGAKGTVIANEITAKDGRILVEFTWRENMTDDSIKIWLSQEIWGILE